MLLNSSQDVNRYPGQMHHTKLQAKILAFKFCDGGQETGGIFADASVIVSAMMPFLCSLEVILLAATGDGRVGCSLANRPLFDARFAPGRNRMFVSMLVKMDIMTWTRTLNHRVPSFVAATLSLWATEVSSKYIIRGIITKFFTIRSCLALHNTLRMIVRTWHVDVTLLLHCTSAVA
jgi:hypothetical protein